MHETTYLSLKESYERAVVLELLEGAQYPDAQANLQAVYRRVLRTALLLVLPPSLTSEAHLLRLWTYRHAPSRPRYGVSAWLLPSAEELEAMSRWLMHPAAGTPPDATALYMCGRGTDLSAWKVTQCPARLNSAPSTSSPPAQPAATVPATASVRPATYAAAVAASLPSGAPAAALSAERPAQQAPALQSLAPGPSPATSAERPTATASDSLQQSRSKATGPSTSPSFTSSSTHPGPSPPPNHPLHVPPTASGWPPVPPAALSTGAGEVTPPVPGQDAPAAVGLGEVPQDRGQGAPAMHSPVDNQPTSEASPAPLLPILDPAFELQDLPLPEPPHFALAAAEREASYELLYGTLALPWIRGEGSFPEVVKPALKASYPRARSEWSLLQALQHYLRILLSKCQVHHRGGCHQGHLQSLEDDLYRHHGVELAPCWSVRQYVKARYGTGALKAVREGECEDAPAVDEKHCAPKPTPLRYRLAGDLYEGAGGAGRQRGGPGAGPGGRCRCPRR